MTNQNLNSIKSIFKKTDLSSKNFDASLIFSGFDAAEDIQPLRKWALDKGMDAKTFDDAHRIWRVVETLGGFPKNVEAYVALYTASHGISARFDGLLTAPRAGAVAAYPDLDSLGRSLRLLSAKLTLPFKDNRIADAISQWLADAKQSRLEAAFNAINAPHPVNSEADWERLSYALADTDAVSAHYVTCVLKTAIWQVKRKLADDPAYPVHDHLMPILSGGQGAGKTECTMRFFAPIADLVARTNFSEITDGKNFGLWSFPVLFLDEMEAADRTDVEAIKSAITRDVKSARILYTGDTGTTRVRSTFWGCTNGTLGDKIADTTGLRRFAPIPVKHAPSADNIANNLPVVDWQAINAVDYLSLWQSVDHRAAHPLKSDEAANSEWTKLCEAERQQDSVEAWLRQIDRDFVHILPVKAHTTGDLYSYSDGRGYHEWCQSNGYSPVAVGKLGRRMASLAAMPWYPFEPSKAGKRGTVHVVKEVLKLAA
jgi:hypothetical protein